MFLPLTLAALTSGDNVPSALPSTLPVINLSSDTDVKDDPLQCFETKVMENCKNIPQQPDKFCDLAGCPTKYAVECKTGDDFIGVQEKICHFLVDQVLHIQCPSTTCHPKTTPALRPAPADVVPRESPDECFLNQWMKVCMHKPHNCEMAKCPVDIAKTCKVTDPDFKKVVVKACEEIEHGLEQIGVSCSEDLCKADSVENAFENAITAVQVEKEEITLIME